MASILKTPGKDKGILIFTCSEKDWFIHPNKELSKKIKDLKQKWLIGLHPNGWEIKSNSIHLFDFIISPNPNIKDKKRFNYSAYNFSPHCFDNTKDRRNWDILHIGRNHKMKNIPSLIRSIKKITLEYPQLNILSICPTPNIKDDGLLTFLSHDTKVRKIYSNLFDSNDYYNNFLFLTLNFEYPRPISLHHLSKFYNNAKIFIDSTPFSLGSRTISYALACGCYVVMSEKMKHMIPQDYRDSPYVTFYSNENEIDKVTCELIEKIETNSINIEGQLELSENFQEGFMRNKLYNDLCNFYKITDPKEHFFLNALDVRLARHHGMGDNKSSFNYTLSSFIGLLNDTSINDSFYSKFHKKENIEQLIGKEKLIRKGYEKGYKLKISKIKLRGILSKIKDYFRRKL